MVLRFPSRDRKTHRWWCENAFGAFRCYFAPNFLLHIRLHLLYGAGEPVALLRNGLYILLSVDHFPKRSAQCGDGHGKISLFDKTVWPDLGHKLFLAGEPHAVLNQHKKNVESFWSERNLALI